MHRTTHGRDRRFSRDVSVEWTRLGKPGDLSYTFGGEYGIAQHGNAVGLLAAPPTLGRARAGDRVDSSHEFDPSTATTARPTDYQEVMKVNRGRWKRHEREVAELLGGQRNPCDGRQHTDVTAGPWAVEVKTRRELPMWLTDAMGQAKASAKQGQTPLVVLTESTQGRKTRRYVVMAMEDWREWHGGELIGKE